ncbi:lactosylceramide -n-acetyl-beta-d-glucosaminyltransferase, partial [Biomphalaria glabrata]
VYFFVGQVKTFAAQSNLVAENVKYNDVIQGSFYDAYVNLTYKAIFVFKWLNQHCQGLRLLLRLDDDVFAGVHQFFDAWKSLVKTEANTIMCDAESNDKVRREGKWLVKKSQIPEDRYFFTHCLGYFVALTPDLVPKIEYSARRTTFFWIDDIFIYGFVAKKVGAKFVNIYRKMARWNKKKLVSCLQTQGRKCTILTFITKKHGDFIYLQSLFQNYTNSKNKPSKPTSQLAL